MSVRRAIVVAGVLALAGSAADACTVVTYSGLRGWAHRQAFERQSHAKATLVVRAEVVSEVFEPVSPTSETQFGRATARITHVEKGSAAPGDVIIYQVYRDLACGEAQETTPGWSFRLYLTSSGQADGLALLHRRALSPVRAPDRR